VQHFWYFLHPTWLYLIQTKFNNHNSNKDCYYRHIKTRNNSNMQTLIINESTQVTVFFTTISLVFHYSIHFFQIQNDIHTVIIINATNNTKASIKMINV
jgi:hypothetical protein